MFAEVNDGDISLHRLARPIGFACALLVAKLGKWLSAATKHMILHMLAITFFATMNQACVVLMVPLSSLITIKCRLAVECAIVRPPLEVPVLLLFFLRSICRCDQI